MKTKTQNTLIALMYIVGIFALLTVVCSMAGCKRETQIDDVKPLVVNSDGHAYYIKEFHYNGHKYLLYDRGGIAHEAQCQINDSRK